MRRKQGKRNQARKGREGGSTKVKPEEERERNALSQRASWSMEHNAEAVSVAACETRCASVCSVYLSCLTTLLHLLLPPVPISCFWILLVNYATQRAETQCPCISTSLSLIILDNFRWFLPILYLPCQQRIKHVSKIKGKADLICTHSIDRWYHFFPSCMPAAAPCKQRLVFLLLYQKNSLFQELPVQYATVTLHPSSWSATQPPMDCAFP